MQYYEEDSESFSGNTPEMTDIDLKMLLVGNVHLGSKNLDRRMKDYVYTRRNDGIHLINLKKFWDKLVFASRVIVSVETPKNVCAVSSLPCGQRAVTKFSALTGSTALTGRFTPGTFTNHTTRTFREPQLIIACDPIADRQVIKEASYVGVPVIAFCDADTPLNYVDICIPSNNKSRNSVALCFWMLAREVLRMRGEIDRNIPWEIMADTFIYRDPEEQDAAEKSAEKTDTNQAQDQTKLSKPEGSEDQAPGIHQEQANPDLSQNIDNAVQGATPQYVQAS